jgi:isoleucyl-tRNA synthetase
VVKFPITDFGPSESGKTIERMYGSANLLVHVNDPWHLTGTHAVSINEDEPYILAKFADKSYGIMSEKRVMEFMARNKKQNIVPIMQVENRVLKKMVLSHPLFETREVPVVVYNGFDIH